MPLELKFLNENDMSMAYETFMEAFADYVMDASGTTEVKFTNRMIKNGVDLPTSVGAFDRGKMVGFTIVAIDQYCGANAAYDAATGIIKPYRGQGLAKAMFEHIVPELKHKGVKRFYLEVIQSNEPAVRAYQKTGFSIVRELDSFRIPFENVRLEPNDARKLRIRAIEKDDLVPTPDFFDWQPTWENSLSSIQRIQDEVLILGAYQDMKLVGFLVYYPLLGWTLNMAVHKAFRREKIGTALLANLKEQIGSQVSSAQIINVEHTDEGMIQFLKSMGAEFIVNQFEMKLDL